MKLTIKANPEITIEIDSPEETKAVERTDVPADPEPKPEPRLGGTRGRKKRTALCSNCGEAGHRKPTCPNDKKTREQDNPFDNDLADKIEGMREEGFSAQYIADDLRLPLETVKRYY